MAGFKSGLIDMGRTTEEKISAIEESMPMPSQAADYPYGLCIHLDENDLEKLGLDDDAEAGDTLHFVAMAKVKSVNRNDYNGRKTTSIDLQITSMACENEDEEAMAVAKRYGKR